MPKAKSVVDVILGEAGGRTPFERLADMLNIASIIHNRAVSGRVSAQDVVSVQNEFNAYDKELPDGVEQLRRVAELVWAQVQKTGPVHHGTFYAMPQATGGLPRGLRQIGAVKHGHVFFADPQGRSFETAKGFVTPDYKLLGVLPETAPKPTRRPADLGEERFAPTPDDVPLPTPRPQRFGELRGLSTGEPRRALADEGIAPDRDDVRTAAVGAAGPLAPAETMEQTPGRHVILVDPQFRPLVTAAGVRRVDASALGAAPPPAPHAARAETPPMAGERTIVPGAGLANLVPPPAPAARDGGFQTGRIAYAHPERGSWDAGLTDRARTAAQMMAAASPTGINITSAYRDPAVNRRAGGARRSQHMAGNAFDLNLAGLTPEQRAKTVLDARLAGATRLGSYSRYPDMLHVDFAKGFQPTEGDVYTMHNRTHGQFASGAPDWFKAGLALDYPKPTPKPSQDAGAGRGFSAGGPSIVPNAPMDAVQAGPGRGGSISVSPGGLANVVPLAPPDGNRISALMPERPRSISAIRLPKSAPVPTARPVPPLPARPISRTPAAALPFKPNAAKTFPLAPVAPITTRSIDPIRRESKGQPGGLYAGSGLSATSAVRSGTTPVGTIAHSRSDPSVSLVSLPGGRVAHVNDKHGFISTWSPADDDELGTSYGKTLAIDPSGSKYGYYSPGKVPTGWATYSPGKGFSRSFAQPSNARSYGPGIFGVFGNKSGQTGNRSSGLAGFLSGLFGASGAPGLAAAAQHGPLGLAAGLFGPAGGMGGMGLGGNFSGPAGPGGLGAPGFGGQISSNSNYGGR